MSSQGTFRCLVVLILGAISVGTASGDAFPPPPSLSPLVDSSQFRVTTFATGLNFPKSMQRLSDGSLLVGTSDPNPGGQYFDSTGTLLRLVDATATAWPTARRRHRALHRAPRASSPRSDRPATSCFVTSSRPGAERISVLRAGPTPAAPLPGRQL